MAYLLSALSRRVPLHPIQRSIVCRYSTPSYKPPTPPAAGNPHRDFYKSWGIPVTKVFLGALLTYQVFYFSWLQLEKLETEQQNEEEIKILEGRLAELTTSKSPDSKS